MGVMTKRCARVLTVLMLAITMVFGAIPIIPGAYADEVDNTKFTVKVVDEQGNPVQGVSVKFEAAKVSDSTRERSFDIPISRPGGMTLEDAKAWNPSNVNGEIQFDLNDEDTPFVDTNDDFAALEYAISVNSDTYTTVTGAKMSIEMDMSTFALAVSTVNGAEFDGTPIVLTVKSTAEPVAEKPVVYVDLDSDEEQSSDANAYVWFIQSQDEISGLTSNDFGVEVKVGEQEWAESSNVTAQFELDPNDENSGTVTVNVPANTEKAAKQWRLTYTGKWYDMDYDGEPDECPAITQAAEPVVAKPEIESIVVDDNYFGTAPEGEGATYAWAVTFVENVGITEVASEDFTVQVKTAEDNTWTTSIGIPLLYTYSGEDAWVVVKIPSNTESTAKQWRVLYDDNDVNCPAITQPAAGTKPEITTWVTYSTGSKQPAAGGTYSWDIMRSDYEEDLSEITSSDFTMWVSVDGAELQERKDVEVTFKADGYTATLTAKVPDNEEEVVKEWTYTYTGGVEGEVPAITQAAKATTEITAIEFDKTSFTGNSDVITATLTGSDLGKLTANDFKLEFDDGFGGWMTYNYGTITVTPAEDGKTATVAISGLNPSTASSYQFTVKNYVADAVPSTQVLTLKVAEFTGVTVFPVEIETAGGEVTATISGSNLDAAASDRFAVYADGTNTNISINYAASEDGNTGTATFTLPENGTDTAKEYTFRVVKTPAQYSWQSPTFFTATELTGADTVITVKAQASETPELIDTTDIEVIDVNDCTKYDVKKIPWESSDYTTKKLPPIYITTVPNNANMLISDKAFTAGETHVAAPAMTAGVLPFDELGVKYGPSCTAGSYIVCDLSAGDPDDDNADGIANIVNYYGEEGREYWDWNGQFSSITVPTAETLCATLQPYALDPAHPEETKVSFIWVVGANVAEGVNEYILVARHDYNPQGTPNCHNWKEEPTWTWTGSDEAGYTAANARFTCKNHEAHNNDVAATVTSEEKDGKTVYTATVEFDGKTYTDTKEVAIPVQKPVLGIVADSETVPADGGECSWMVFDPTEEDLAVSASDFAVQVNTGERWEAVTGITPTVVSGENDYEATVSFTVEANDLQTEKQWRIAYEGGFVEYDGQRIVPCDCPAITQAAKAVEPEDPAVDAVVEKINELPDASAVTADSKAAIEAARTAYDALSDEQKAKVDEATLKKLTDAEEALKTIEDAAAVDAAKEKINALPAADKVTTADKAAIEAARAAYNALTDEQKAAIDADTLKKLTDAEKALSDAQAAEAQKAAEEKAKSITSVTVSGKTVNAAAVNAAIAAAGGSPEYVTEIVLAKNVKKISKKAFAGTKVTTLVVQTKKLTKKSVKGSLKGSSVKTVKVKIGKAKVNKKYVKKYKKIFTKKNAGKKAKVKK